MVSVSMAQASISAAKTSLQKLLHIFPIEPTFAFAYGSQVKKQEGHESMNKDDMIDLVIAVDDATQFHTQNTLKNPSHYSFLKSLPGNGATLARVQENFGAKVFYNTLVRVDENTLIKYGVITTKHLINDLLDWDSLYIAGRLHKPVQILAIDPRHSSMIEKSLKINHQSAIHAALLLLEDSFTEKELYSTITKLSYLGDFRMIIGEDKNKIENIVKPQMDLFRSLYQPYLASNILKPLVTWNKTTRSYVQDTSAQTIYHHLNLLPKNVQKELYFKWANHGPMTDLDDVLMALSQKFGTDEKVKDAICKIVKKSSLSQSVKGIFTAGVTKSISYSKRKLVKMYKSMSK